MEFIVISEQLTYILYSAIFGFFAAFVYVCIKILRITAGVSSGSGKSISFLKFIDKLPLIRIKGKKAVLSVLLIHITDILYLMFTATAFSVFAYYFNHGRIRWYLIFGAVIGYMVFYHSVGRLIMYLSEYIVYIIKSFTKLIVYGIMSIIGVVFKPLKILISEFGLRMRHRREHIRLKKYIFGNGESNGT